MVDLFLNLFSERWSSMNYKKCVYQFKITLQGIQPVIWRRIQVPTNYSFWDLHVAIQDSMGWLDYLLGSPEHVPKSPLDFIQTNLPVPSLDTPVNLASPDTCKATLGLAIPIPTLPFSFITIL